MSVTFRRLPSCDRVPRPWKNGGGITTEIAIAPPNAALDAFDWRVSMARVASDGPFSLFPGIDRTLAVLDGHGLRLAIDGASPVRLDPATPPLSFPGDVAVHAVCEDGPITDFNVMTRRGDYGHALDICDVAERALLCIEAGTTLILCRDDEMRLSWGADSHLLGKDDAIAIEATAPFNLELAARTRARAYVVRLNRVPSG